MKKKLFNLIIMKNEKKIMQKIELGYYTDCIVRKKIVLHGLAVILQYNCD